MELAQRAALHISSWASSSFMNTIYSAILASDIQLLHTCMPVAIAICDLIIARFQSAKSMNASKCGALNAAEPPAQLLGTCRDAGRPGDIDELAAHGFFGLLQLERP